MLHFEIVPSKIFNTNCNLVWIGEQPYIKMLFWQISMHHNILRMYGKMQNQHFNVSFFSNPWEKVLILVESRGQICPIVLHLFRTMSPGETIVIFSSLTFYEARIWECNICNHFNCSNEQYFFLHCFTLICIQSPTLCLINVSLSHINIY